MGGLKKNEKMQATVEKEKGGGKWHKPQGII